MRGQGDERSYTDAYLHLGDMHAVLVCGKMVSPKDRSKDGVGPVVSLCGSMHCTALLSED